MKQAHPNAATADPKKALLNVRRPVIPSLLRMFVSFMCRTLCWRVNFPPVLGDIAARANPNLVVLTYVVQEPDQPRSAPRPADQSIVQANAQQLRRSLPF